MESMQMMERNFENILFELKNVSLEETERRREEPPNLRMFYQGCKKIVENFENDTFDIETEKFKFGGIPACFARKFPEDYAINNLFPLEQCVLNCIAQVMDSIDYYGTKNAIEYCRIFGDGEKISIVVKLFWENDKLKDMKVHVVITSGMSVE
jgi:hypothetical protein